MFRLKIKTEMQEVITYSGSAEEIADIVSEWLLTYDETPIEELNVSLITD